MSYRVSIALLLLAPVAGAQDFSYPDFSNMAGIALNGSAAQSGVVLRVTPSATGQKGSAFYDQATKVSSGFVTTFTFQISSTTGGGADGMAFVIHNAAAGLGALGDDGSGMGYAENPSTSIENCLALEFDTWNSGLGDPDDNHVSLHTGGTGPSKYDEAFSIGNASVLSNISDGAQHTARLQYENGILEVFVDDLINPLISVPWDFATGGKYINGNPTGGMDLINGTSAWVGFTGGTGGAAEDHDVISWEWRDGSGPIGTNYCGPSNLNSTGQSAVIGAFGSLLASANDVRLDATQMPPSRYGVFINSQTQGFSMPPNSLGYLCLSGEIGFYTSNVFAVDSSGLASIQLDLTQTPTPSGLVAVQPGETWYFQAWYRDQYPAKTSNFTDGVWILFQ